MRALATAVRALERRRDVVQRRIEPVKTKLTTMERELEEIGEALTTLAPMAKDSRPAAPKATATDPQVQQAEKLWRAGEAVTAIARKVGVTGPTLYSWRTKYGWPKKPGGK